MRVRQYKLGNHAEWVSVRDRPINLVVTKRDNSIDFVKPDSVLLEGGVPVVWRRATRFCN